MSLCADAGCGQSRPGPAPRHEEDTCQSTIFHSSIFHSTIFGKKVAFLLTDGVEQVELTSPWDAVKEAGGVPTLVSPKSGELQGYDGTEKGQTFAVDLAVGQADAADFHALVIPGGVVNADHLRVGQGRPGVHAGVLRRSTSRSPPSATARGC